MEDQEEEMGLEQAHMRIQNIEAHIQKVILSPNDLLVQASDQISSLRPQAVQAQVITPSLSPSVVPCSVQDDCHGDSEPKSIVGRRSSAKGCAGVSRHGVGEGGNKV